MLVKLDRLDFGFAKVEERTVSAARKSLSRTDWIRIDRIVMALMFLVVIVGSLLF